MIGYGQDSLLTGSAIGAFGCIEGSGSDAQSSPVATSIAFVTVPTNTPTGEVFTITVEVLDQRGNRMTNSGDVVTLALEDDSATGSTLGGDPTQATVAGLATFADLEIDQITNFTVTANALSLTEVESDTIAGWTPTLVITQEAATHAVTGVKGLSRGAARSFIFTLQDGAGNAVDYWDAETFTLAVQTDPTTTGNATALAIASGTTSAQPVDGVITFTSIVLNTEKVTGIVLRCSGNGLTKDTTAFASYHPIMATSLFTHANYLYSLVLMNTVGPRGELTITDSSGAVSLAKDALTEDVEIAQATADNQPTTGAWNAPPTFGPNDVLATPTAELLALENTAVNAYSFFAICDAADANTAKTGFIVEVRNTAGAVFRKGLGFNENAGAQNVLFYSRRVLTEGLSRHTHGVAENTPIAIMGVSTRNAATKSLAVAGSTAGTSDGNTDTNTDHAIVNIGGRYDNPDLFYGNQATASPRIWLVVAFNADASASMATFISECETALGIDLTP